MKWSNLYLLKRGWSVQRYDLEKGVVEMYHLPSGLAQTVKIPPLFVFIAKEQRLKGSEERAEKIRGALGIEESWL